MCARSTRGCDRLHSSPCVRDLLVWQGVRGWNELRSLRPPADADRVYQIDADGSSDPSADNHVPSHFNRPSPGTCHVVPPMRVLALTVGVRNVDGDCV